MSRERENDYYNYYLGDVVNHDDIIIADYDSTLNSQKYTQRKLCATDK